MSAKFPTAKIAKDLNPLKYLPTSASSTKTTVKCNNILWKGCPDWDSDPGPIDYRPEALPTELHSHLGNLPKSLRLIANHWACEYREKTTPSQIFIPCNLSSCGVLKAFTSFGARKAKVCHQMQIELRTTGSRFDIYSSRNFKYRKVLTSITKLIGLPCMR